MNDGAITAPATELAARPGTSLVRRLMRSETPIMLYAALIGLVVVFGVLSPAFLTVDNFANVGRQTALVSIMAVGVAFVIVSGEIDLSVGSTVALSGLLSALAMQHLGLGWLVGALAGLATGALVGLVNGVLTVRLAIPSFLVTLGMMGVVRGVALMATNTQPVLANDFSYQRIFGEGYIAGIPAPIAWTVVAVVGGFILLHHTVFGQKVFATGGNATAARYSGINTNRVRILVFVISGILAGFAALVMTARFHAARPDVGSGLELDVIAAVILGGTSLFGGRGTILGAFLGSILIGVINNGLILLGVDSSVQLAIKGLIIIVAVAISRR
ncbi:ABC transporter permease [Streptomyces sp. NPDC093250]|uniref:ABC transporter permease n=1 Tax=Streptomyces sp. NPDC093250 TaxID=3366036 RepID=UPI0037F9E6BE